MMKKRLIIITGITMAGKSSTTKELVKQLQTEGVAIKLLKETTTRPKRESDYSNPEYHFVTEEEYNQKDFLVSIDFKVSGGETWKYGIEMQDFPELSIIVSNMYAIDYLLSNPIPENLDIDIFYLNISEEEALRRDKGDRISQTGDNIIDRIKRDINNNNDIYEKHVNYISKVNCDNTTLKEIVNIISLSIKGF
jgi:guanylate kinase